MIRFISRLRPARKDTYNNILANGEFVVNVPSYEREILEKVRVVGSDFRRESTSLRRPGSQRCLSKVGQAAAHRRLPQSFRMQSRVDQAVAAPPDGVR